MKLLIDIPEDLYKKFADVDEDFDKYPVNVSTIPQSYIRVALGAIGKGSPISAEVWNGLIKIAKKPDSYIRGALDAVEKRHAKED